jgi:hypothetical protein
MSNLRVLRCSTQAYQRVAQVAGEKGVTLSEALDSLLEPLPPTTCSRFGIYDLVQTNAEAPSHLANRQGVVIAHFRSACILKFSTSEPWVYVRLSWIDPLPLDEADPDTKHLWKWATFSWYDPYIASEVVVWKSTEGIDNPKRTQGRNLTWLPLFVSLIQLALIITGAMFALEFELVPETILGLEGQLVIFAILGGYSGSFVQVYRNRMEHEIETRSIPYIPIFRYLLIRVS